MSDSNCLNEKQRKFAEENHNLIYKFLATKGLNTEEYYGVAALGYTKAVKSFDDTRGIRFSTFAYRCMQNEVYMSYRTHEKQEKLNLISLDAELADTEGISLLDHIIGEDNMEQNITEAINIEEGLTRLYTHELEMLKYRLQGLKHKEIAEKMEMSQPNVSRILSKDVKLILNNKPMSAQRKKAIESFDKEELDNRNKICAEIIEILSGGQVQIELVLDEKKNREHKKMIKQENQANIPKKKPGRPKKDKYDLAKEEVEMLYRKEEERLEKAKKINEQNQARLKEIHKSRVEKVNKDKEELKAVDKEVERQPKICIYAGDFDPITIADMDIIHRASKMFDEVIVLVTTTDESNVIQLQKRLELVKTACYYIKNIKFDIQNGLVEEYAAAHKANILIKVVDKNTNLDELIESVNLSNLINSELEVITMQAHVTLQGINSDTAKMVARRGGDISNFVPFEVEDDIKSILKQAFNNNNIE